MSAEPSTAPRRPQPVRPVRQASRAAARRRMTAAAALLLVLVCWAGPSQAQQSAPPDRRMRPLWLSPEQIAGLPTSGTAWAAVKAAADGDFDTAALTERNKHNTQVLAAALAAARLDDDAYRARVRDELQAVTAAGIDDGDVLAAARRLGTYAIAADLAGLAAYDPAFDRRFRGWLAEALTHEFDGGGGGGSVISVHERRPNNFGTHAGASRIAAAAYLGDREELDRAAEVFAGWLGEPGAYDGFDFGGDAWQASPTPVGVNPPGAVIDGHDVDGALPDDQRRGGGFSWPPEDENYVWEALQGAAVAAELLDRQGYDAWEWGSQALLRAAEWLHEVAEFPAEGDDSWTPWLLNHAYHAGFPTGKIGAQGKNMAWCDWTHAEPDTARPSRNDGSDQERVGRSAEEDSDLPSATGGERTSAADEDAWAGDDEGGRDQDARDDEHRDPRSTLDEDEDEDENENEDKESETDLDDPGRDEDDAADDQGRDGRGRDEDDAADDQGRDGRGRDEDDAADDQGRDEDDGEGDRDRDREDKGVGGVGAVDRPPEDVEGTEDAVAPGGVDDAGAWGSAAAGGDSEPGAGAAMTRRPGAVSVTAAAETDPVPHPGDAADDPAIWLHPTDPARSTVIGTDKDGGLGVYDLDGRQLHFYTDTAPNNVDVRGGFPLRPGEDAAIVAASDERLGGVRLYTVDPDTRGLGEVGRLATGVVPYGLCLYHNRDTDGFYAIVTSEDGPVEQWRLTADDTGRVGGELARSLRMEGQSEGCAADDDLGRLYIAEEQGGLWRYAADPDAGEQRHRVDAVTDQGGRLSGDIEGVAVAADAETAGEGWLVVSSQGSDSYFVYDRAGENPLLGSFAVTDGGVDGAEETDGLDVTAAALGGAFPGGLLVVQDGANDDANQNFKLIGWEQVVEKAGLSGDRPLPPPAAGDDAAEGPDDCSETR